MYSKALKGKIFQGICRESLGNKGRPLFNNQEILSLHYHVTLLREVSITEALWSHPLDRQLDSLPTVLSEVVLLKYILRETKIGNLYPEMFINPTA